MVAHGARGVPKQQQRGKKTQRTAGCWLLQPVQRDGSGEGGQQQQRRQNGQNVAVADVEAGSAGDNEESESGQPKHHRLCPAVAADDEINGRSYQPNRQQRRFQQKRHHKITPPAVAGAFTQQKSVVADGNVGLQLKQTAKVGGGGNGDGKIANGAQFKAIECPY